MPAGEESFVAVNDCVDPRKNAVRAQLGEVFIAAKRAVVGREQQLLSHIMDVAGLQLAMHSLGVFLDDHHVLNVGRVFLDDVEVFLLWRGFHQNLRHHAVAANAVGDLARVLPELVAVDIAAILERLQNLVERIQPELRGRVVLIDEAQRAHLGLRHARNIAILIQVRALHAGMEDEQLPVRGHVHVDLYHVRALPKRDFIRRDRVAGDVPAANAAMRDDQPLFPRRGP